MELGISRIFQRVMIFSRRFGVGLPGPAAPDGGTASAAPAAFSEAASTRLHVRGEDEAIVPISSTPHPQVSHGTHSLYLPPSALSLIPPDGSPFQPNFRYAFLVCDPSTADSFRCHVIQIPTNFQTSEPIRSPFTPVDLRKTFLSLTFQGMINFVAVGFPKSSSSSATLLRIAEMSLVVGFSASFSAILLHQAYPELAAVLEKAGYIFAASGFFLMMSLVLPTVPVSVGWVCAACVLAAFLLHLIKLKRD